MRSLFRFVLLVGVSASACAQWQVLDAHTTADFRGVHYVGNGVAWVSGTDGTVLRTEDMGKTWTHCVVPPGAEKLDFRGVQAFDAKTAVVMSSGPGGLSRLYKTVDGCATWKLLITNPDREGFWDALNVAPNGDLLVLGDPVHGKFKVFCRMDDDPAVRECWNETVPHAQKGESVFAASNASILNFPDDGVTLFATGGPQGARIFRACDPCTTYISGWKTIAISDFPKSESAGIFSLAARWGRNVHVIAVGGDYKQPDVSSQTAAFSSDYGEHWQPSRMMPGGYRSSVGYDSSSRAFVAVGPNGSDFSLDDGRSWKPLRPSGQDAPDADRNWNALSLPFGVGPKGRIGLLREEALAGLVSEKKTPRR